MSLAKLAVTVCVLVGASSCIAHESYRTDYTICTASGSSEACDESALHVHGDEDGAGYFLGFVEFDDQGVLWHREQADAVVNHLLDRIANDDFILVVFVHGWKHSAAPGDSNIAMFEKNLALLSGVESKISARTGRPARKVAGVYLGWRGGSVSLPLLKELTFWDRKNTAHKVGHGGVTEILTRLEEVRELRETLVESSRTCLVIVGHSFGGAVVFSALGQILEERFVTTTAGARATGTARGFGDLVVLINPAFEAQRYASLSDMSSGRHPYFQSQLPVLAILTSEDDRATRNAFPIGRFFSTLFEKERVVARPNRSTGESESVDQGAANVQAVGHFDLYRTHFLSPTEEVGLDDDVALEASLDVGEAWENDKSGGSIAFPGTRLERRESTSPRNPYLVVGVSGEIIPNHNDIDDPRVVMFLSQLILLSSQDQDLELRTKMRASGRSD